METQTTISTITPGAITEVQFSPAAAAPAAEKPGELKFDTSLFMWLIFLALGGGILALYYSQIGYLPDIEWHSLLLYLAAATILGASLGILFSLLLFLPGCIWAELIMSDAKLRKTFYPGNEPCVLEVISRLGVLFGVVLLISHILLPIGIRVYLISTAILLLLSFVTIWWAFKRNWRWRLRFGNSSLRKRLKRHRSTNEVLLSMQAGIPKANGQRNAASGADLLTPPPANPLGLNRSNLFKYAFWFVISVTLSQAAMLLTYYLAKPPEQSGYYQLIVFCTSIVLISNHIVAARYCHARKHAVLASLVAAFLMLCAANRFTSLPQRIMAFYGFGGERRVTLLLNKDGADIVSQLGLPDGDHVGQEQLRIRLNDVQLLSTVGSEWFLSYGGKNFTLPKSMIVSWTTKDPRPADQDNQQSAMAGNE